MKSMSRLAALMLLALWCIGIAKPAKADDSTTTTTASSTNPFVYRNGNFSTGIVSGDAYQSWDIFHSVGNINARAGGSITLAQYGRFGAFVGAAAPSNDPKSIALTAGPQLNLDDAMKAAVTGMLEVLPFNLDSGTISAISSAFTLKVPFGYDFRNLGWAIGAGVGVKKVF